LGYFGENDRRDGRPFHGAIVMAARDARLAGATVLRGPMSFGRSTQLHAATVRAPALRRGAAAKRAPA